MADEPSLVKCLVWDLDNTLWQGTLLEDNEVGFPTRCGTLSRPVSPARTARSEAGPAPPAAHGHPGEGQAQEQRTCSIVPLTAL
jgi:hypothetical protein